MTATNWQRRPYPLGTEAENGKIRFSFVSKNTSCGILLYDRATGKRLDKIPFESEDQVGNVHFKTIENINAAEVTYQFYANDEIIPDERARVFFGQAAYGKEREWTDLKAGFPTLDFDWEGDKRPRIPYHQALVYCMHVRGFTKHISSKVKNKGTFAGIAEKIPYLKEIGITTLELQPAYEFLEIPAREEFVREVPYGAVLPDRDVGFTAARKLNYWGYKLGYYYAPKAAYAGAEDPTTEFKELVRELHRNGMELVMQFYFPREVSRLEIPEILRFWVWEYHVDGFHLIGEDIPSDLLACDDLLSDTKLWYYQFHTDYIYGWNEQSVRPHVAEYNDSWCYDMRRFLKGDEGMLNSVLYHMRHIPEKAGCIHYLTNYSGFTLADLVSYDYRHNEANGEDNRDGSDYNCSWNCGEEGASRKPKIRQLRIKQVKNAMCLLLLSQSTPLIFMGDEFGNSQKGNNNPYCLDNAVTWLDWSVQKKNEELLEFWKQLVAFRREHPILHPSKELRLMDSIACGYPDLSYHGQNAWRPQTEGYFRYIGILLCGEYAETDEDQRDTFVYLALNMHWESHELALPRLPKELKWYTVFATDTESPLDREIPENPGQELMCKIPPRCITVFVSTMETGNAEKSSIKREKDSGAARSEKGNG